MPRRLSFPFVILLLPAILMSFSEDAYGIGKGTGDENLIFEKAESESWQTNTYGADDVVLHGFEPLEVRGNTVELWGRSIVFNKSIMPEQIVNQGQKMLARPISWHLSISGKTYPLIFKDIKLESSSQTRAVYEGLGKLAQFSVSARVTVEYDGFMKFEIVFDPRGRTIQVGELYMDIPFVPTQFTNLYHPTRRSGVWQDGWKSKLTLVYTNIMTLGTPDTCLQWLTESDEHYYPRDHESALQTLSLGPMRVFRTNVIAQKKPVNKPIRLVFALHAGPVKPRPPKWRGWTMKGRKHLVQSDRYTPVSFSYYHWAIAPGSLIPRKGFPEKPDRDMLKGMSGVHFSSTHFVGVRHYEEPDHKKFLPWWAKHKSEWLRLPGLTEDQAPEGKPGWINMYVDTNSTWSQWHVYTCQKLFDSTGIRGLYYDNWRPGTSVNQAAGSGYLDEDGELRPTNPIFSHRELHRRVYAIVHKARPRDGIVVIHTATTTPLPVHSFCDVIYDGESLQWHDLHPPGGNYFKTWSNGLIQSIYACKQYGPVPVLHDPTGYYMALAKNAEAGKVKNQRIEWAILMSHDMHAQGGYSTGWEDLRLFWLDHFDIADPAVEFHSYWNQNPAVKVMRGYWHSKAGGTPISDRQSKMWAVAYAKPGKSLIVVVRDAPDDATGRIQVDLKLDRQRLGLPDGPLRSMDLETLCRAPKGTVQGDILTVPVSADDFALVVVESDPNK